MAVQDWLNAKVVGNASVGDIGKFGMDAYNTYQTNQGRQDAADTVVGGYDAGISKINQLADESRGVIGDVYGTNMENIQPYLGAGQTSLDQYMGLMSDPSTIMDDPGAKWRYDMGLEATKRDLEGAGYADPMGSGARPRGITEYGQGYATQELDRALERRMPVMNLGSEATRTGMMAGDSYQRGMTNLNKYQGNNLAELYLGKADAQSTKSILDSMATSDYMKGAGGLFNQVAGNNDMMSLVSKALGGGTTSDGASLWDMLGESFGFDSGDTGIVDQALDLLGGGGDTMLGTGAGNQALTWGVGGLDDALGAEVGNMIDPSGTSGLTDASGKFMGIDWGNLFGGGGGAAAADTMLGTGAANQGLTWGAGGLDAAMGGAAPAAGGGAGAGSMASLGYAAAGVGAIFAMRSVVDSLRGESFFNEAMGDLANSQDPLGDIQNLKSGDLPKATSRSGKVLNDSAARGSLYSAAIGKMNPEQVAGLKAHEDIDAIAMDLFKYLQSGQGESKHAIGASPTESLKKLFPGISAEIDRSSEVVGVWDRINQLKANEGSNPDAITQAQNIAGQWQNIYDEGNQRYKEAGGGTNVKGYIEDQLAQWKLER